VQEALHLARAYFGPASQETGMALSALGRLRQQQGQSGEAKNLYMHALDILQTTGAQPTDVSALLDNLAGVYSGEHQWALANQTYERALDIDRRVLGDDHPRVAMQLYDLAVVAQDQGDLKQAETFYREAIRRLDHAYGDRHPRSADAKTNYALLLQREGRFAEAEPLLRSVLDTNIRIHSPDNYNIGYARANLGVLLHDEGDLTGAEAEFRQALATYDKTLPAKHPWRAALLMQFARLLVDRDELEEALARSEQSLKLWADTSSPSGASAAQAHAIHADVLAHLGRSGEAADELSAAVPILLKARGPDDPVVRRAQLWLNGLRPAAPDTARMDN
jgi:tetratricopeptide (TPR) repeat protein